MKALVLAGGVPQIELICQLKKRGYTVILADYHPEPVAKKYADIFYQESTLDVEAIRRIAIDEKIDFLITVCTDQALLTVAKLSEELGLPCYLDYQTGLNVTNKAYMKSIFKDYSIPTADYRILKELDERQLEGLALPLIVKPVDCNSSKGVRKVENRQELQEFFYQAKELSRTKTAIVEKYVEGEEVTVDVYVENGVSNVLAVSRTEKIAAKDKFVIFRTVNPAPISDGVCEKISVVCQKIADAFSIKDSPMLVQMIVANDEVFVLEFSARTGGGEKFKMIKQATGFDVIEAVIDLTEGKKPHLQKNDDRPKMIVNEFLYCEEGIFDHLEGFDELKEDGTIADYYLLKWKGVQFNEISSSGDRVAWITFFSDSVEELEIKHSKAVNRLRVIDSLGKDMLRHDLMAELKR